VTAWRRGTDAPAEAPEMSGVQVCRGAPGLAAALPQARVLINLLPLTDHTRGLLDARLFGSLPRGAAVVNLARGAHLVDVDLLAALDAGQIGHAVLDVFATEPLPAGHPYWHHPAVTVLPHAAAMTDARSAAAVVARNIEALAAGRPLADLVARCAGY
jgi:glyoxylate/hydroxypyruvate reductase A